MSRATTAVVLSALVLPGAGQIYLKHYWRGLALAGISLVCLWFIIVNAMHQASVIMAQIESGGSVPDAMQIASMAEQASTASSGMTVTVAMLVLVVCWVASIVDVYRLAKRATGQGA